MKKKVIIQCDGLADKEYEELDGKTPLEYAKTPIIDTIVEKSIIGTVNTIPDDFFCGSYYGNLGLLGVDFSKACMKFGPFSAKLNLEDYEKNEYALICKWISTKENSYSDLIIDSNDVIKDISKEEIEILVELLNNLKSVKTHRAIFKIYKNNEIILLINQNNIDVNFQDTYNIEGKRISDIIPIGKDTLIFKEIYEEVYQVLKDNSINIKRIKEKKKPLNVLLFSEGDYYWNFDTFSKRVGTEGTLVAGTRFLKMLGELEGLKVVCPKGATGGFDTDLDSKVKTTIDEIKDGNNIIFLHINMTDEVSHRGNLYEKVKSIEKIDKKVVKAIVDEIRKADESISLMIVTDHYTCCSTKEHERGCVPFLIYSKDNNQKQDFKHFCEKSCQQALNFNSGKDLFEYFIK